MSTIVLAALAVTAAYLIGAIPFGYLTARWAKGIDIRTVGSGNIGATNVGRILGPRYFLLVFALDLLKGFLPTYGFPRWIQGATGEDVPALGGVAIALAAILGHNFPIYLRFRGGKGVATSLGALLALDAVASLAAAVGFVVFLLVTRYVSLSSILGGLVFALAHFTRTEDPWKRDHFAMSLLTIILLGLLVVRHRKNLARIGAGTEPKVRLRPRAPGGRAAWVAVLVLAGAGVAAGLVLNAARRSELAVGRYTLTEVARVRTGHQRAERLAFADEGRLLAVTCPRYNRVVLYRVTGGAVLEVIRDISLGGRPVAIRATADRLFILQRPIADAHHLEAGYWETFDFAGKRDGSLFRAGWDPDDLLVTGDGQHVLVLNSGSAEGESNRPAPSLNVFALDARQGPPRPVGHLTFDRPGDDPERLSWAAKGRSAVVHFRGSDQVATIDLEEGEKPKLTGRSSLPTPGSLWAAEAGGGIIFSDPEHEALWIQTDNPPSGLLVRTLAPASGLEVSDPCEPTTKRRFWLRGPMNLSSARPTGLAWERRHGLLAVADRSGGVHLIAIRPAPGGGSGPGIIAESAADVGRVYNESHSRDIGRR